MNVKKIDLGKLNILRENNKLVPVFFACDDGYVKYLQVTLRSLVDNVTLQHDYKIHILSTDLSDESKRKLTDMETENVSIEFTDITEQLKKIEKKISVRDYYSATTYYRIFIAEMFPQYDKVLYLDADTILLSDVADLYNYNLGDNYVGAVQDYIVDNTEIFGDYVENVLGISRSAYFNAGVLSINTRQFRKHNIEKKFIELLNTYSFVVAQDQDYLNILCQNNVLWINSKWNVQMSEPEARPLDKVNLIHYNFAEKPWHKEDGRYADIFWEYAGKTSDYEKLREQLTYYSEDDRKKAMQSGAHLLHLAQEEISNENNYYRLYVGESERSLSRQDILDKIKELEREGRFDEDVEDDPPSRMLMPDEIDYLDHSMQKRLETRYAFKMARWFMKAMMRKKMLIINKKIYGIENFRNLDSGAVITCNHFNAFDSFAIQVAYEKSRQHGRKFYRIIKEGNYTSFPGFFGFLMRNCNTLPLSSNSDTMKKLLKAVDKLLQAGHFVLIYPEQSMWWNYRKPKPLKKGGFIFAARSMVPVLPCFITMQDTNIPGEGGLPVQEYTIHVCEPIYPDPAKTKNENVRMMMEKNFEAWKNVYEETYKIPLTYETETK